MNMPKGVTHYSPSPTGEPQLWYRLTTKRYNTGEEIPWVEYYTSRGMWHGTLHRELNFDMTTEQVEAVLVKLNIRRCSESRRSNMKVVGLSLSFCVKAILEGQIPLEGVSYILCGFKWAGTPHESYYDIYWSKWTAEQVDDVLSKLDIRPAFCEYRNISRGYWMTGEPTEARMLDSEDRLTTEQVYEHFRVE